ncbi:MAG: glutathione S-transferase family protein [Gammaproteobacteria bacterium]
MITLFKFHPAFGLTDPSPFCVKVETFLRMVAAEYRTVSLSNPRKGPKGKLPFITDDAQTIADSTFILKYLNETYRYPIDANLKPEQHAVGLALTRMLEEHLYWVIVYERWFDPVNWARVRSLFFGAMPPVVRSIVPLIARASVKRALYGQGLGRHQAEEIQTLALDDIRAVSDLLGSKTFILGETYTSYDASVFAFLSSILYCTLDTPSKKILLDFDNLKQYCDRIREAIYPET